MVGLRSMDCIDGSRDRMGLARIGSGTSVGFVPSFHVSGVFAAV
jgi:hypothetical protein